MIPFRFEIKQAPVSEGVEKYRDLFKLIKNILILHRWGSDRLDSRDILL